jgi:fructuronate reductase
LRREAAGRRERAPVRVAHLGLGNFFRALPARVTDLAHDADAWGIAAFGGRSARVADLLAGQDDLYTLITRSSTDDRFDLVSSVSSTAGASDAARWREVVAAPTTAVVTATVTEAGWCLRADGALDLDRADVTADAAALRRGDSGATAPGRVVEGLAARFRAGGEPIAVVPCDNLPANGQRVGAAVRDLAALVDASLVAWIAASVAFVSTVVDRITPRTTDEDVALVAGATGWRDRVPVVAEPFGEWVLAGAFPIGRPAWETAGARFVDDVTVHEERKLRLLNGAHSLLAYVGSTRGHTTVADAMADEACRALVAAWWSDARGGLPLAAAELDVYEAQLVARFENARIRHPLAQIAADGSQKLVVRVVPTIREARARADVPIGAVAIVAGWACHLRGVGAPVDDVAAATLAPLASGPWGEASRRLLGALAPDLGEDRELVAVVADEAERLADGR